MIRPVSYAEILDAPNSKELLDEYAKECLVPDYNPQRATYEAMERSGGLHCFGAFYQGCLIGFVSVVSCVMPHNGKLVGTVESIFVASSQRYSGAGLALIARAEGFAREFGCVALVAGPRIGSRMAKILSHSNWDETHTVFTRWL